MRYLVGQFFIWGLGSCLCLLFFIAIISFFDGQTSQLKLHVAIFHIYLWPIAVGVGVALRTALLHRRGEWLALQCVGWSPKGVMLASAIAGLTLGVIPFSMSMWGWTTILGLSSEAFDWVWHEEAVIRLNDGLRLAIDQEIQYRPLVSPRFEYRWLPLIDCLQSSDGLFELQQRLLRLAISMLSPIIGTLSIFIQEYRWLSFTLTGLAVTVVLSSLLSVSLSWGILFALVSLLYWLGSRM